MTNTLDTLPSGIVGKHLRVFPADAREHKWFCINRHRDEGVYSDEPALVFIAERSDDPAYNWDGCKLSRGVVLSDSDAIRAAIELIDHALRADPHNQAHVVTGLRLLLAIQPSPPVAGG